MQEVICPKIGNQLNTCPWFNNIGVVEMYKLKEYKEIPLSL